MTTTTVAHPTALLGGRFVPGRLIKSGQSADVHLGRDVHTGEPVALKLLRRPWSPRRLQRFLFEAQVASRLEHPGLVKGLGFGTQGEAWIAFELVPDATSLDRGPRFGLRWWIDVIRDAAFAIGEAHRKGIAHRDLRGENLLIDAHGRVRILDFSQASSGVDPRVDVWSLAALLREGISHLRPSEIPFELARVLERALSRDLEDRPPSGLALAKELAAL